MPVCCFRIHHFFLALSLLCVSFLGYARLEAQSAKVDSLALLLNEYQNADSFRLNILLELAASLDGVDQIEMYQRAIEGRQLAQSLQDSSAIVKSSLLIGLAQLSSGKLKSAYQEFLQIEKMATKDEIQLILADAKTGRGKVYDLSGRSTDALEMYFNALKLFERLNEGERIADLQHDIGSLYSQTGQFDEALNYYGNAIAQYDKVGNLQKMAFICVDKADLVRDLGRTDEALIGYRDALDVFEKYGYNRGASLAYLNMGKLFAQQNNYQEAESNLMQAASYNQKEVNPQIKVSIDLAFADQYERKKNGAKAALFYDQALKEASENQFLHEQLIALDGLKRNAQAAGRYSIALNYADQISLLKDSLSAINSRDDLDAIRAQYELELAENQNMILEKERDVQKAEILRQQEEAQKKNLIFFAILILLVVIFFFSVFLWKAFAKQKKLGADLSILNSHLSEANAEIKKMNSQLEQRVKERTNELSHRNKQLESYAFKHSHELRAPLSRLMGLVQLAQIDAFETQEEKEKMIKGLDQSALELDEIVRQMADELDRR